MGFRLSCEQLASAHLALAHGRLRNLPAEPRRPSFLSTSCSTRPMQSCFSHCCCDYRRALAAFIAALFAWHPLHVESVAWISERKDVLSTLFALLTLLSYTKYVKENCCRSFWFALVFLALGLISKPMLVTLPFVMLLLDFWPLQRFSDLKIQTATVARVTLEKWPFFLLAAISCVVTFFAQRSDAMQSLAKVPLQLRFENTIAAYVGYLVKMVWPVNLSVFYPLPKHILWPVVLTSGGVFDFHLRHSLA
jgi:hypothetical protein